MKSKGKLLIISGPSGVGKGTVCKELLKKNDNIVLSVSATTRTPRDEDVEGITYYFKTRDEFQRMIDNNQFLEWAEYSGNYYGTPLEPVNKNLENGKNVILEIDVQGALNIKKIFHDGIYIFIDAPSEQVLVERLRGRNSETEEQIKKRIAVAKHELTLKNKYDYVVTNDVLENTVAEIENIIKGV